jgi:hypothetical protein
MQIHFYLYDLYLLLTIILIPLYLTIFKLYYDSKIINSLLYSMIIFLLWISIYYYYSLTKMKIVGLELLLLLVYQFILLVLYLIYLLNILVRNDFKLKNYSKNETKISLLILLSLFLIFILRILAYYS